MPDQDQEIQNKILQDITKIWILQESMIILETEATNSKQDRTIIQTQQHKKSIIMNQREG